MDFPIPVQSVLTGFTFGVAINVAVGQLFKITGTSSSGSNVWQKLWTWITALPESSLPTLVVGITALVLLFGLKLFAPKIPAALVAVVLGILATAVFSLDERGVALIAAVPRGLPSFSLPDLTLNSGQPGINLGYCSWSAPDRVFRNHSRSAEIRQYTQLPH